MMNYILIVLSILILFVVVYVTIKPLKIGIEAKQNKVSDNNEKFTDNDNSLSEEIYKLKKMHDDGILSDEEFDKAKKRVLD